MAPLKVIGGGYGRTGTDSLRTALNMLGYKTHHMKSFFDDPTQKPDTFYHAFLDKENADYDKIYENYDAAVDWPTVSFYKELLAKYPDAKVVLTERSADSWYKSVKNTIHGSATHIGDLDPNHPSYPFARMASTVCLGGIIGDPVRFDDEEKVKQMFLDHNAEVKRFVPKEQLLVMELGEGWERLCKFLGKEVPEEPYPSVNSTAEFKRRIESVAGIPFSEKPQAASN